MIVVAFLLGYIACGVLAGYLARRFVVHGLYFVGVVLGPIGLILMLTELPGVLAERRRKQQAVADVMRQVKRILERPSAATRALKGPRCS